MAGLKAPMPLVMLALLLSYHGPTTAAQAMRIEGFDSQLLTLSQSAGKQAPIAIQPPTLNQTVLILGDSVDRLGLEDIYPVHRAYPVNYTNNDTSEVDQLARIAHDLERSVSFSYMFIRGVGYNGDLKDPFRSDFGPEWSTMNIIRAKSLQFSEQYLGTKSPDLVVVGSGLWDLTVWLHMDNEWPTQSRIQQWCEHDLLNLLTNVSASYPSSRIAFRTTPSPHSGFWPGSQEFSREGVEAMSECIGNLRTAGKGKLFGKYEVLDYHGMMENLTRRADGDTSKINSLWREDGYHPSGVAARSYINWMLEKLGAKPLGDAVAGVEQQRLLRSESEDFDDAGLV